MRYVRPELGNNTIAYKGRRYWLIEIAEGGDFDGWKSPDYGYVLVDCLLGGVIALIANTPDGKYSGSIISHFDCGTFEFSSIQEAVNKLIKESEEYSKALGE